MTGRRDSSRALAIPVAPTKITVSLIGEVFWRAGVRGRNPRGSCATRRRPDRTGPQQLSGMCGARVAVARDSAPVWPLLSWFEFPGRTAFLVEQLAAGGCERTLGAQFGESGLHRQLHLLGPGGRSAGSGTSVRKGRIGGGRRRPLTIPSTTTVPTTIQNTTEPNRTCCRD